MPKKAIEWSKIGFGYMPTDYRYTRIWKDGKDIAPEQLAE